MSENNIISVLENFVGVALRNRKYAPNTAYGYKAALKVFGQELSPDERASLELFKERFGQIFSNIVSKKQNEYSISSLQIYKNRVQRVLDDYEKFGVDPSKMGNWAPSLRNRAQKNKLGKNIPPAGSDSNEDLDLTSSPDYSRHEYSLRPPKRIVIIYPSDFSPEEAKSIKSFAEYLVSMRGEDHS